MVKWGWLNRSMTERQILFDAINVDGIHHGHLAETTQPFGVFGLGQVTTTRARAQDFAGAGYLEPFSHRFLGFDAFRTTHKFNIFAKDVNNKFSGLPWQARNSKITGLRGNSLRY